VKKLLMFLVCASALIAAPAHTQSVGQARAFVRGLYAQYGHPKASDGPNILGPGAARIFSPQLLQLIRKSDRETPKGDVGVLDFDPVCSCQDPDGLGLAPLDVKAGEGGAAVAVAMLHYPDSAEDIRVELSLKWFPSGWRIDEISTKDVPSLRKLLTGSVK
jgi:Protein of unknown function (DUF3828)